MALAVAVLVVVLLAALTAFFVFSARVIRKDIDERFKQFEVRLENEANSVVRHLRNQHQ